MRIILTHPTGNEFVRALAYALFKEGLLEKFVTTVATDSSSVLFNVLPKSIKNDLLRRSYPIPQEKILTYPFRELSRILLPRIGGKRFIEHEKGWASVDNVYRNLDRNVAQRLNNTNSGDMPDAVYAYEDGAIQTFNQASALNIERLYDLPIGYWRAARVLLGHERERWPDWAETLTGLKDSDEKLNRKDDELKLATSIFVASNFTASTLNYYNGKLPKVNVIPYAFPPVAEAKQYENVSASRPLKLLFVGGLSQRKGVADLFAAAEHFGSKIELTVVGSKVVDTCTPLNEALKKHKWIPSLPHAEILTLMRGHDVLIFPSLFEGFGLVITEAMAQGTPVITTDRTAGPDIISNHENGWLIQAASTDALKESIEAILLNPGMIKNVGMAARETAKNRTWENYGRELVNAIINNK
ncbi:glycosyltransferase [Mucilaginibacter terrenus]|uniref:Glycosyltransferase n=1 Tax=Mucilaginibacter terrenus TaxID=2482727 RepID=A0A3E2NXQ6_9SPHI|nr:glycosyltransferase family 4 protein [Mucilaginibacter terrenus]RFZ85783.1 glycosyltransferase [Mucilaginibacter terrenus]